MNRYYDYDMNSLENLPEIWECERCGYRDEVLTTRAGEDLCEDCVAGAWCEGDVRIALGEYGPDASEGFELAQHDGYVWRVQGYAAMNTYQLNRKWRRDGARVHTLITGGRICSDAVRAMGVDDPAALLAVTR